MTDKKKKKKSKEAGKITVSEGAKDEVYRAMEDEIARNNEANGR
jgi:hypothetical protein